MDEKATVTHEEINKMVYDFLKKYPLTITWRLKQHSKIIAKHINPNEKIFYIFPAQKNSNPWNIYSTCILAFTDKRILIAQKNILWGYSLFSITPDMFNDFEVYKGLIFGRVDIDTIKEVVKLSDIDPRALVEIETNLSEYLHIVKPKYKNSGQGIEEKETE